LNYTRARWACNTPPEFSPSLSPWIGRLWLETIRWIVLPPAAPRRPI